MEEKKKIWFRRKWYGWGWYPASIEGWLVTLLFVGLAVFFGLTIDENSSTREVMFTFILPLVLLVIAFLRICYHRGEKPRWNWGRNDRRDEKTWEEQDNL